MQLSLINLQAQAQCGEGEVQVTGFHELRDAVKSLIKNGVEITVGEQKIKLEQLAIYSYSSQSHGRGIICIWHALINQDSNWMWMCWQGAWAGIRFNDTCNTIAHVKIRPSAKVEGITPHVSWALAIARHWMTATKSSKCVFMNSIFHICLS